MRDQRMICMAKLMEAMKMMGWMKAMSRYCKFQRRSMNVWSPTENTAITVRLLPGPGIGGGRRWTNSMVLLSPPEYRRKGCGKKRCSKPAGENIASGREHDKQTAWSTKVAMFIVHIDKE